jgi:hypothetical protein
MTDPTLSTLLTVLVVITFVVASAALVSLARVEYLYRKHAQRVKPEIRSVVLVRQRRWAWFFGISAIPVAILAGWAILRSVLPDLRLGGLPAPFTLVTIVVLINLPLLWLINLARAWGRIVKARVRPDTQDSDLWDAPEQPLLTDDTLWKEEDA